MAILKVMITGATGMVGEGVLFECLQNNKVSDVLMINRKPYNPVHPKLKELIVPDFLSCMKLQKTFAGTTPAFFARASVRWG